MQLAYVLLISNYYSYFITLLTANSKEVTKS